MNHSNFVQCMLIAGAMLVANNMAIAQLPFAAPIITGPTRCDHVIQLMLRHGVNNRFDRSAVHSLLHSSPLGCAPTPGNELGDLQVLQVNQLPPVEPTSGPKFAVIVTNQSTREVCNFHVTAVAVFGHICSHSPNNTVKVDRINPGEALEVIVQLPIEALSMGRRNGEVLSYQKLVVAIDSLDELLERDEANNIKAFDASELGVVVSAVNVTAVSVLDSSNSLPTSPVPATQVSGPPSASANAEVSVDALDLEHPTPDSLRSAIQQVGSTGVPTEQPVPNNQQ